MFHTLSRSVMHLCFHLIRLLLLLILINAPLFLLHLCIVFTSILAHISLPSSPLTFLPLRMSDSGEGGGGSPPGGGARSVPATDGAESGPSLRPPDLVPPWRCPDLPVHLSGTRPRSSLNRDSVGPDASSSHSGRWHEGSGGMEGAQLRQGEMGHHQGAGEREAVAAERTEGHADARHRTRWAERRTRWFNEMFTFVCHCVWRCRKKSETWNKKWQSLKPLKLN